MDSRDGDGGGGDALSSWRLTVDDLAQRMEQMSINAYG
jgi:hypothetical protein